MVSIHSGTHGPCCGPSIVLIKSEPCEGGPGWPRRAGHLVNGPRACARAALAPLPVPGAAAAHGAALFKRSGPSAFCPARGCPRGAGGAGPVSRPLQLSPLAMRESHGVGGCTSWVRGGVVPCPLWLQAHSRPEPEPETGRHVRGVFPVGLREGRVDVASIRLRRGNTWVKW